MSPGATYLAKAEALQAKGMMAIVSSDIGMLCEAVRASGAAYRALLTAAKFARTPREHRQGAPDLALEMEHAVDQIVEERADGLVDVRGLAAGVAVAADQHGATIEAGAFVGVASALTMCWLTMCWLAMR